MPRPRLHNCHVGKISVAEFAEYGKYLPYETFPVKPEELHKPPNKCYT